MKSDNNEIIWKDRKRFFGLPISFTRYSVKGNRLYNNVGFFSSKENEILLYRILDFKLEITLINRLFRVGTVTLYTCDKTDKELKLIRIKNPRKTRDMLSKMVEDERGKIKIKGKEIYGSADSYEEYDDLM